MYVLFCFKKVLKNIFCAGTTKETTVFLEHLRLGVMMILQFACSYISYLAEQKKSIK